MTLEQLRIFVAVAEHGHVTRAAEALGMTQSAASAALAALQRRYGARLFDRIGRGIALTDKGRAFLPEARLVLERAAAARHVLEDMSDIATGTLRIAASQTIASYWLPRRLAAYHREHPRVRLDVVIGNTRQVEAGIVAGSADLGLVEGPTQHAGLVRRRVDDDRLVLVTAASEPAPPETGLGQPELRAMSWILREEGSGTRSVFEDLVRAEGLAIEDLRVFLVLPANEAVREAVEAGAGATVISEHVVAGAIAAGRLRATPLRLPPREFALVWNAGRHVSVAQRALIRQLTPPEASGA